MNEVIVEDDEYDGISYLPTPPLINDKMGVGQSSNGDVDHKCSGNTLCSRCKSKDSDNLLIPN